MLWTIAAFLSCVKLLFVPAYRSTDFEVHRNWLAITHSLPVNQWYLEKTSEWTLDYPPFFAYFEYVMSHIAYYFDPNMLIVSNLNYASYNTVLFQRLSVIVSDLVLVYGTKVCSDYIKSIKFRKCSKWGSQWHSPATILQLIILGNVGLLLVDHIHFQYNGILLGILLISIEKILRGHYLAGAFWFAVLLNMKHIYLYMALPFAVYLFRNFVLLNNRFSKRSLLRLAALGLIVISVFLASFGPFILMGQLPQLLSRLFPFKRGLCHAYWAPNFWAVYNVIDKVSTVVGRWFGFGIPMSAGNMTSGLVQEYSHTVLPSITPITTMLITVLVMFPCLRKLWNSPGNPVHFVRSLVICSSCSFLFGWHVHEKAILMIIIPLSLTAVLGRKEAEIFVLLATVGHYSLLPLIFTPMEYVIKILLFLLYSTYVFRSFSELYAVRTHKYLFPILPARESVYLLGFVPLFLYETVFQYMLQLDKKYPFLPLMLTSFYCAIGIIYGVLKYYHSFLLMDLNQHKQKTF